MMTHSLVKKFCRSSGMAILHGFLSAKQAGGSSAEGLITGAMREGEA
jgi:hypothetical protein